VTPSRPSLSRFAKPLFLSISAGALVAIVIIGTPVMLPFLLALVVAYVLMPAVRLVERIKVPRWVAILIVYAVTLGAVGLFSWATIPRLFSETKKLSSELPKLTSRISNEWLPAIDAKLAAWVGSDTQEPDPATEPPPEPAAPEPAPIVITPRKDGSFEVRLRDDLRLLPQRDGSWALSPAKPKTRPVFSSARALKDAFDKTIAYAQHNTGELLKVARALLMGVSRGVFYLFITLMLAGYLMYTYERIRKFVRDLWPVHRRSAFDLFLTRVDRGLAGVVRGQLLICLVNGVLSAIGFWIFDVKYWPILAVIAGIMSIVPIFGSILSSIPAVAIALTEGTGTALGVLIWIVGIHQLEANFLNPKIIGDAAKIHPVLVVFALLVGEHLYGIPGALLAVPCWALIQALFLHFRESILGISGPGGPLGRRSEPPLQAATAGGSQPPTPVDEPDAPQSPSADLVDEDKPS